MAFPSSPSGLPWLAALAALAVAVTSCTVLFDYGSDESGSGGAGQGGAVGTGGGAPGGGGGGTTGCVDASDCDDGNGCTEDSCSEGACANEPLADGETCTSGGGQAGTCMDATCTIACTGDNPSVCDDDNVCTVDGCDVSLGQCENEPVPDGEADASEQTDGDCQVVQCVAGQPEAQNDDGDVPVDNNACTSDVCTDGVPSNANLGEGTSCGGTLVCDGNGVCVGCNQASDCPGSDSFCQTITCSNQQCGVDYAAAGTPLPENQQTAGQCKQVQCNGTGGTQIANLSNGTSCDDDLYCNGTDSCLSGNCSQHSGDPCPGPDGDGDCSETCDETNAACTANDTNGSDCDDGSYCNGKDTCQSGSCSQHSGDPCPGPDGDSDCSETCNEADQSCSGADPSGSSCDDGLYCNGIDECGNTGSCNQHSGSPCPGPDFDSDCSESCNELGNNCSANDLEGSTCSNNGMIGCCGPNGICYDQCV